MLFSGNEFFIFKVHYSRCLGTRMCRPMEQLRPSGLQIWFIFEWALLELSSFKKHLSHPGCWIFWHNTELIISPAHHRWSRSPSCCCLSRCCSLTVFFQLVILAGRLSMALISSKNQPLLRWFFFNVRFPALCFSYVCSNIAYFLLLPLDLTDSTFTFFLKQKLRLKICDIFSFLK